MADETDEVIDVESRPAVATAVARPRGDVADWTPRMVISVDDAVAMIDERQEFMDKVLSRVKDALVAVPGSDKKALGKPGAERLLSAYGLHPETFDEQPPVLDFTGAEHGGEPLFLYRCGCRIWRQTGPGEHDRMLVASARGLCSSREVKYRYRTSKRVCPECGADAIKRSKFPPRDDPSAAPGWYCHDKAGGCGAQFSYGSSAILDQQLGRVPNPEVADQLNTILKMADKRALVAATIMATGWSDIVTQDLDEPSGQDEDDSPAAAGSRTVDTINDDVREVYAAWNKLPSDRKLPLLKEHGYKSGVGAIDKWMASLSSTARERLSTAILGKPAAKPEETSASTEADAPVPALPLP